MGSTRVCAFLQVCRLEYPMGSKQVSSFESFFVPGLLGFRPSKSTVLGCRVLGLGWVLPPLSNSWIMLYLALNRTPNIDCYWVGGQYPRFRGSG